MVEVNVMAIGRKVLKHMKRRYGERKGSKETGNVTDGHNSTTIMLK